MAFHVFLPSLYGNLHKLSLRNSTDSTLSPLGTGIEMHLSVDSKGQDLGLARHDGLIYIRNEFSRKLMILKSSFPPHLFQNPGSVISCSYVFVDLIKVRYFCILLKSNSPNSHPVQPSKFWIFPCYHWFWNVVIQNQPQQSNSHHAGKRVQVERGEAQVGWVKK